MLWLDSLNSLAAGLDFVLASLSCAFLIEHAREARSRARRAGSAVLALVCAGLALEGILYLSQAPAAVSWTRLIATAVVRGVLLSASALIALLLWRNGPRPR